MRIKTIITIIAGFIFAIASPFVAIAVNETPHNASKTVSCGNCHGKALLYSPFWGGSYTPANIDDTVYNKICLECHTQPSGPYTTTGAPLARTHSSLATDAGYGNWTRECRDCHNPHYQKQSLFKRTDSSNLYLARGTITSCGAYNSVNNTTTLTYSGITYKSGWDSAKLLEKTGSYRRAMLVPNVGKLGYNYPIIAIDGTTIKVEGDATAAYQYISPPTTFAVTYGQYVKDLINVGGTNKTVKFFDKTGTKSFADGDATYDGVCEVCHTQTTHFRNNGGGSDPNHANIGGAGGTNCISCHTHPEGFKASCNACHGYPPIVNSATSPDGLVWILPVTGSATAGAHNLHVNTKSYQCDTCHYQNITQNKHNKDPRVITLGFYMFSGAYQGGSYDGQSGLNYNTTTTTPVTTVANSGAKTCSSLYCHGGTMAPNGGTASAIWDVPASAACGTCHGASTGAPPQRGSHPKHAGSASGGRQLECTICHKGYTSVHVNGSANWAYDTTTYTWLSGALYRGSASGSATPVPGASYGTCTNLYCHSQGTSNTSPYPAPNIAATWGGALDNTCTGCHRGDQNATNKMATGSHTKHIADSSIDCTKCHNQTASNSRTISNQADHVNNLVNVAYDAFSNPGGNGTYNGTVSPMTKTPGTAYSNCTNLYCHGSGTPTWGGAAIPCDGCHKASNILQGKHSAHYGTATVAANRLAANNSSSTTYIYNCGACHDPGATAHAGGPVSSIQAAQVAFDATYAGGGSYTAGGTLAGTDNTFKWTNGTCSSTYCHSPGNKNATYDSPNITPTWNGTLDATCSGCHSGDKNATNKIASGSHTKHVVSSSIDCTKCHNATSSDSRTIGNEANHVNRLVNVAFDSASDPNNLATYNGSDSPMTKTPASVYGNCTNLYCHGSGTPAWGGPAIPCDGCHKASNILQGKHSAHYESATVATNRTAANNSSGTTYAFNCGVCHNPGTTIHAGGPVSGIQAAQVAFDATYAGGGTYTGGALAGTDNGFNWTAGTCATTYCHSPGTKFSSPYDAPNVTSFNWNSAAGTLQCNGCHGNTTYTTDYRRGAPLYATGSPKQNAHRPHTDARASAGADATECSDCHNATTNNNTLITGKDKHVNAQYDVTGGSATYASGNNVSTTAAVVTGYAAGNCSNVSCHPTGTTTAANASTTIPWNDSDSSNYQCTDCHSINLTANSSYHHSMNSETYTPGATTGYSTTVPQGNWSGGTNPSSRTCLMCHIKHNFSSNRMNTNAALTAPRAMNLRNDIAQAPTVSTNYTNTDYINSGTYGICISCHTNELTKDTGRQVPETNSTKTAQVTGANYSTSAHQYNVATTMKTGNATFNSNCSKCHNAKTGEGSVTFQNNAASGRAFGMHDSTLRRLLATLGMTSPADPEEEDFCYRCHSKTTDTTPGGGPAKGTAGRDYYGTAGATLTAAAEDIFTVMQKGTAGTPDSPTTTTNTLYFKPSAQETVSGVAPTDHYTTTQTTNTIYLKRAADDSTLGTSYPNTYFISSGTYNATTYWRRVMTPTSGGTNENTAYTSSSTANQYQRHAQFISLPLSSNWTINNGQSFTLNIEDYEGNNASNGYTRYNVRRYTGATGGTVVNTAAACESGTEMGNNASATYYMQTITCSNNTGSAITFNAGDYIVLEVETINKATTTSSFREQYGNNNARLTLPSNATFDTEPFAGGTAAIRSMSPIAPTAANETVGGATDAVGTNASTTNPVTQRWKKVVFVSPPVATATTTTAAAWTINVFDRESSGNAGARVRYMIYTWTAGGTFGSTIVPRTTYTTEMGTTTAQQTITTAVGNAVSLAVGDKIVVDLEIETNAVTTGGNYSLEYTYGSTSQSNVVMPGSVTFTYTTPGTPATGRHDVAQYSGKHKPSSTDETLAYISTNKHVECADCHNPHAAGATKHTKGTNAVSPVLASVSGAIPSFGGSVPGISNSVLYFRDTDSTTSPIQHQTTDNPTVGTFQRRDMLGTTGNNPLNPGQQINLTTTTSGTNYRGTAFVSGPLSAGTIAAGDWQVNMWAQESNTGANAGLKAYIYVWRPSTSAVVGVIGGPTNNGREIGNNTTNKTLESWSVTGASVTVQAGDRVVVEVYPYLRSAASASTYNVQMFWNGSPGTDDSNVVLPGGANWTAPVSYTLANATAEYQICFKCHSSANTNYASWGGTDATSWTDVGLEFSPNNRSGHPIVTGLNSYPNSLAPKALVAAQMSAPWNVNLGTQTMYCTDCHETDSAASKGPHASAVKWMLAGTNKAWPYQNYSNNGGSTGTYWTLSNRNTNSGTANGLFCLNCHPVGGTNNAHSESNHNSYKCVDCHIRVPHGGKVSRLISTQQAGYGMPARYFPDGKGGDIDSDPMGKFTKASSRTGYDTPNCDANCHGSHQNTTGESW